MTDADKLAQTDADCRERARARLRIGLENCRVPHHLREGLVEYAVAGRPTGQFLAAFLAGDLFEACARADDTSALAFKPLAQFAYGYLSVTCYGNHERVQAWTGRTPTLTEVAAHG
jgi:hypothetical protein